MTAPARVALTLGIFRAKGHQGPGITANGDGPQGGVRGFFLYSYRRLLVPYLLLEVQRSSQWGGRGAGKEDGDGVDVVGVIEIELPASVSKQELLVSAAQWRQLGAETERCYRAYLAQHSPSSQVSPMCCLL